MVLRFTGALFLVCCSLSMGRAAESLDLSRVANVVEASHAAGNFDGVVVIVKGGQLIFSKALGDADRARHAANRVDVIFRLASLTKQVTALLVMQEVASGRLSLETVAGSVLPSLPSSTRRVTVKQLLQHVSGMANPSDGPDNVVPPFYLRTDKNAAHMSEAALGFCSGEPKRDPGKQFEYNNCDYIVLGALLEKLNGISYAELVQRRIIKPLQLASWGLFPADPKSGPATAIGYQVDGSVELSQNPATYGSAGALYGNALDVAKWDAALLSHKLLSAEATATMFQADPKLYGEALGSWAYDLKFAKTSVHLVERQGDIGSTRLLNLLLPDQDAAVIIIANTDRADLFDTYSRKGLGYEILNAIFRE